MGNNKKVTNEELHNMVLAQGVPMEHMAFKCPRCNTVQSPTSLIKAGAGKDFAAVSRYIGFICVGRFIDPKKQEKYKHTGAGCDWSLGGLFKIHKLEVVEDGKSFPYFEVATPEEAKALMKAHEVDERQAHCGLLLREVRP